MGNTTGTPPPPANDARIALKRSAVLLSLAGSFVSACLGVGLASLAFASDGPGAHGVAGAFALVALFLTIPVLRGVHQVIERVPGLVVEASGLRGDSVAWSGGFVPWSNISGFSMYHVGNGRPRVFVRLVDEDAYLAGRGLLEQWTPRLSESPVWFDPDLLDIDTGYLLSMLDQLLAAHRNQAARGPLVRHPSTGP